MKPHLVIGLLLIVVGVFLLAYRGIAYSTTEEVADIGPLEISKTETETVDVPPLVGGAILAGGVVVLLLGGRSRAAG